MLFQCDYLNKKKCSKIYYNNVGYLWKISPCLQKSYTESSCVFQKTSTIFQHFRYLFSFLHRHFVRPKLQLETPEIMSNSMLLAIGCSVSSEAHWKFMITNPLKEKAFFPPFISSCKMTDALRRVLHFNPSQMDSFVQGLDKRKLYSCSLPFRHKVWSRTYTWKLTYQILKKIQFWCTLQRLWSFGRCRWKKIGPWKQKTSAEVRIPKQ